MPQGGNGGGGKAYKNDLVLLSAEEEATAALTSLLPSPCFCCVVMAGHTHCTQHRERERASAMGTKEKEMPEEEKINELVG